MPEHPFVYRYLNREIGNSVITNLLIPSSKSARNNASAPNQLQRRQRRRTLC